MRSPGAPRGRYRCPSPTQPSLIYRRRPIWRGGGSAPALVRSLPSRDLATRCSGADGTCLLLAVEPSIANTGATLTLEGSFAGDAMVNFPGGVSQVATVLGPHRAQVIVPSGASAGDLTVTSGGQTLGSLHFRRASFTLGLGPFQQRYAQADNARTMPAAINSPSLRPTSFIVGDWLYLIGLDGVFRATINADGTLSPFARTGVSLATAGGGHASVVVGSSVYVIGGGNGTTFLDRVECATINSDGSISNFAIVPGVGVTVPRGDSTAVIIGNSIDVIGGYDGTQSLATVERATINADGSISNFALVPGVSLATPLVGHTSVIIGRTLYVIGGFNRRADGTSTPSREIQRADIAGDGTLSSFSVVAGVGLNTARAAHTTEILGSTLAVIGGIDGNGNSVADEHATINSDGTLTSFATTA